ncbi:MATE family efflux transporter [Verrucomicrobiota bacterium sgz303538]
MSDVSTLEPPRAPVQKDSVWKVIAQALRGEHHDYTSEPLQRAVLLLAIPMVLEMVMESVFAVADVFWVSRLGKDAVAVVGITESLMTIIYAIAIGLSMAAGAVVARRIGEKDSERAAITAGQVILLGVTVSAALGLVLGWFAPQILRLMGASDNVVSLGSDFARIMLGGNATVFLIFLINAVFRGAGDATIAMRTLWLANAINIALGPCFIFGWGPFPALGVAGAAVATNIGRGVGVLYQLWHLTARPGKIHITFRHLRVNPEVIKSLLQIAGNGIAQNLIGTTSWIGLVRILSYFGSAALAGYTIGIRIVIFALLPAWGLSNAGATLVGQNLGAQQPERAEEAVWISTRYNTIFLGVIGLIFVVFATPIVRLFSSDPEVLAQGSRALWIIGLGFPLYAAGMCLTAAFNGAGDTWTPTLLNLVCFWLIEIPLAWVLARTLGLAPTGVFIAIPVSFSAMALWSYVLFQRGKWKQTRV